MTKINIDITDDKHRCKCGHTKEHHSKKKGYCKHLPDKGCGCKKFTPKHSEIIHEKT